MGKKEKQEAREKGRKRDFIFEHFNKLAIGFTALALTAGIYTFYSSVQGASDVQYVPIADSERVRDVLFSGVPTVVACVYANGRKELTPQMTVAAQELRGEVPFVLMPCDEKLPSGKTVPERVKLNKDGPQAFVALGEEEWQLPKEVITSSAKTVEYIRTAAKPRFVEVKKAKDFEKKCLAHRSCVVIGYRHKIGKSLKKLISKVWSQNRRARVVAVNTQKFQVKLDEKLLATRPKRKSKDSSQVFGIISEEKGGKTYGSFIAEESEAAITNLFAKVLASSISLPLLGHSPSISDRPHKLAKKPTAGKAPRAEAAQEEETGTDEETDAAEEESGTDDEDTTASEEDDEDDDFIQGWDDLLEKRPGDEM